MKITVLLENTGPENLKTEHGLSLWLQTGAHSILFDAGQSPAFAQNAECLGVDLKQADWAVLSHGHYDHAGGLSAFLEINRRAPVYLSRYAYEPHFGSTGRDVGIPEQLPGDRLIFTGETMQLAPGITLVTLPQAPACADGMTTLRDGRRMAEDFRHEQYLLVEERGKRILISGCSHKGIVQIAEHFRPDVLVGGFHFMHVQDKACLECSAQRLLELCGRCYTGHCTGTQQFAVLKAVMADRLGAIQTGTILEI